MDVLIEKLALPIVVTVIAELILLFIKIRLKKSWSVNFFVIAGVFIAILVGIVVLYLPPYSVTDVRWCLEKNDEVRVTGRLVTSIFGAPVPNYVVQTKIYEAGYGDPFKQPKFPTTADLAGTFVVTFPPPTPKQGTLYVINTAYKYDTPLLAGRWWTKDFSAGEPSTCNGT